MVAPPPVCPECRAGKHDNCDTTAWDNDLDAPVPCECWKWGHEPLLENEYAVELPPRVFTNIALPENGATA